MENRRLSNLEPINAHSHPAHRLGAGALRLLGGARDRRRVHIRVAHFDGKSRRISRGLTSWQTFVASGCHLRGVHSIPGFSILFERTRAGAAALRGDLPAI